MPLFKWVTSSYVPDNNPQYAAVDQRRLARVVGLSALGLPIALIVANMISFLFGDQAPILRTCFRDSISHYYYAPFWGGPFVGVLVFIATYLFVYTGEDRERAESRLATFAGLGALGIAIFPTSHHGCDDATGFTSRAFSQFGPGNDPDKLINLIARPEDEFAAYFQMFPLSDVIHYGSALVLFSFLTWFCFVVFRTVDEDQKNAHGEPTQRKIRRNRLYFFMGSLMLFCMVAMGLYAVLGVLTDIDLGWWNGLNLTFWFEAIAMIAFGLSWMIKGRFLERFEDRPDPPGA